VDPTGLEYGYIRDFVKDLEMIFPWGTEYTFSGSGADRKVTIKVGDGYMQKLGCFYMDGRVAFPRPKSRQSIKKAADNIDGKLYMERTDFYKAMGITYIQMQQEVVVSKAENFFKITVVDATISIISSFIVTPGGALVMFFAGEVIGASVPVYDEGKYNVLTTVAEVYNRTMSSYEYIYTQEYWMVEDSKGIPTSKEWQDYVWTKYLGSFSESVI
jgi:hypothetical protein